MKESTVSSYEYALIVGSYHAIGAKERIDPQLLQRGYTKEQIAELEKRTISNQDILYSCNLKITGDLKRFKHESFYFYLTAFRAYEEHGILPFSGAYGDQPAKIIEVFEVFEQLKFEETQKIYKEQEREMKRLNNGRR